MSSVSVFDFSDYKEFLRAWIDEKGHKGRGLKTKLAQAIGCNSTYVAHILHGKSHLSLEQGEAAARFKGLDTKEKHYFLLLIQLGRAGTVELRRYFETQRTEALQEH